eukprot:scaffold1467_cov264-Pinguiococcus_pyrenoidosus.AAC.21
MRLHARRDVPVPLGKALADLSSPPRRRCWRHGPQRRRVLALAAAVGCVLAQKTIRRPRRRLDVWTPAALRGFLALRPRPLESGSAAVGLRMRHGVPRGCKTALGPPLQIQSAVRQLRPVRGRSGRSLHGSSAARSVGFAALLLPAGTCSTITL